MIANIMNSSSDRYNALLLKAQPGMRGTIMHFERHVMTYLANHFRQKFGFVNDVPVLFVGLFGTFFGFGAEACAHIGAKLLLIGRDRQADPNLHRVAVSFYTSEDLLTELNAFVTAAGRADITYYPKLFGFV